MFTRQTSDELIARTHFQDNLAVWRNQLSNFTAWINGSNSDFSLPTPRSSTLPLVHSFLSFGDTLDPLVASYAPNITGFIRGDVRLLNITPPALNGTAAAWVPLANAYMGSPNMTELARDMGTWNWTTSDKINWNVVSHYPKWTDGREQQGDVALVHGRVDFFDDDADEEMRLNFEGVHFVSNGSIYGFAEPYTRSIDLRYLPALVPEEFRNATAQAIVPELTSRITKLEGMVDAGMADTDTGGGEEEPLFSSCGFNFYAQLAPLALPVARMAIVEEEIQHPTGLPVDIPQLDFRGVLLSRECGLLYQMHSTEALRSQIFFRKVTTYAGFAAFIYLALLLLSARQMDASQTPAGLSRACFWTFLAQAAMDAISFAGHITFAILTSGRASRALIAPAFLACIGFAFESKHAIQINQVQVPEDTVRAPATVVPLPPATPPVPVGAGAQVPGVEGEEASVEEGGVPAQTTTVAATVPARPAVPAPQPQAQLPQTFPGLFWQHLRTDPQARIWLGMFLFLTFIVRVIVSPSLALLFLASIHSAVWLPQIVRSAVRGRTSGLRAEYVVGVTVCRVGLIMYFLACPKNILDVEPRPWVWQLALFISFQGAIVLLQTHLGPAFFLPKRYAAAHVYDYHPPLPPRPSAGDPEAGHTDASLGDCAICMEAIRAEDPRGGTASAGRRSTSSLAGAAAPSGVGAGVGVSMGLLKRVGTRRHYSLAPCHHLFHTECLERWLAIKNICPQCRRLLPPL
ncbi:hypothetical protein CONPUDRAFT_107113 [Coniophora puteana RWD-64-598 SS2]|uniref:RING-type E3 ubiquitin transferase n=1 Tax=Coniophora puteana (strain RWD-64-598) TaxID=741705 RepID=A0A5M3MJE8_CONPW|nr:uncharacterized protein CONPUDRAFT_107113 [Coniophora puteana RWD-64-598 SS2]EIW79060.1 hypothetical protein CONPUDRAFT_107113 [Coniophora puteana RWD-64-598 SS2]